MENYTITLETPIGKKHGRLTAEITDTKIAGCLCVMNAENSFDGEIDSSGRCTIYGNLKTLLYQLSFVGSGKINNKHILLTIKTDRYTLLLKGEKNNE